MVHLVGMKMLSCGVVGPQRLQIESGVLNAISGLGGFYAEEYFSIDVVIERRLKPSTN